MSATIRRSTERECIREFMEATRPLFEPYTGDWAKVLERLREAREQGERVLGEAR